MSHQPEQGTRLQPDAGHGQPPQDDDGSGNGTGRRKVHIVVAAAVVVAVVGGVAFAIAARDGDPGQVGNNEPTATTSTTTASTTTSTTAPPLTEADMTFVAMVRADLGVERLVGQLSSSDTYSGADAEIVAVGKDFCEQIANDPAGQSPEEVIGSWQINDPEDSYAKIGLLAVNFFCDQYGPVVQGNTTPPTTVTPPQTVAPPARLPVATTPPRQPVATSPPTTDPSQAMRSWANKNFATIVGVPYSPDVGESACEPMRQTAQMLAAASGPGEPPSWSRALDAARTGAQICGSDRNNFQDMDDWRAQVAFWETKMNVLIESARAELIVAGVL